MVSVIVGRVLERLGFTDALIRIFLPVMGAMGINPSVIIPSVYNILGDINASGKIAGPILVKAGATQDEIKLSIATMIQNPQSLCHLCHRLGGPDRFRHQPAAGGSPLHLPAPHRGALSPLPHPVSGTPKRWSWKPFPASPPKPR